MVAEYSNSTEDELQIFNNAWNYPNPKSQRKEAIWKEFRDKKKQTLRKMHKNVMPPSCKCVQNKWIFKMKHNSMCQAQLTAWGYNQVPGVHFSENYSPILNDITFCILLLMVIHFRFLAKIVDVKTTSYMGTLKKISMECSQGISDVRKDVCIILYICIYGLVKAVRQYCKKTVKL